MTLIEGVNAMLAPAKLQLNGEWLVPGHEHTDPYEWNKSFHQYDRKAGIEFFCEIFQ
jgi:hypothetical protein